MKINISKFIKYFRRSLGDTIKLNLIKRGLIPVLKQIRGLNDLPSQVELLRDLLKEDSFTLIILDACRYDIFSKIYRKYLSGTLVKAESLGSNTFEWMPKAFSLQGFREVKVFSAHPAINSLGIEHSGFRATEFLPKKIIDIWECCWNEDFNTVLPQELTKCVIKEGLDRKNLIWYMQPHFPWLLNKDLSKKLINESIRNKTHPEMLIREKIKISLLSRNDVVKCYVYNLQCALRSVSDLIRNIKKITDRIIVTSDHGELLGEYGFFAHYPNMPLPELIIVPWLVIQ
jgi:hypothetical protein